MGGKDVFYGLSWGNLRRYQIRHDQTVCLKSAEELDELIRELMSREQTDEWAVEAKDFCDRVAFVPNNIMKLLHEGHRMAKLRDLAQARLRMMAKKLDDTIGSLWNAPRTTYWCREVRALDEKIPSLPRDVKALMTKLDLLEKTVREAAMIEKAEQIEEQIRELIHAPNKDRAWLTTVEKYVHPGRNREIRQSIRNQMLLKTLTEEYWRVVRAPIVKDYAEMLNKIEDNLWEQQAVREQFHALDSQLSEHDFDMSEYIDQFRSRWMAANTRVRDEEWRLIDEENRKALRLYVRCLNAVEQDASAENIWRAFDELDKRVNSLSFNPDDYYNDFSTKWEEARRQIQDAKEYARAMAEQAAREEAQRKKEQQERERARIRRMNMIKVALFAVGAFLFTAFYRWLLNGYEAWWQMPFMISLCSLFAVHLFRVDDDTCYEGRNIANQIILCLMSVFMSWQMIGRWNISTILIAVACIAPVVFVFNFYPRMIDDYSYYVESPERYVKLTFCILLPLGLVFDVERLFFVVVESSLWNALWLVPISIGVIGGMGMWIVKLLYDDADEPTAITAFIGGAIFDVILLIHMVANVAFVADYRKEAVAFSVFVCVLSVITILASILIVSGAWDFAKKALSVFLTVIKILLFFPISIIVIGAFVSFEVWWYSTFVLVVSALFYIHLFRVDEDTYHKWYHIIAQIYFYAVCLVFTLTAAFASLNIFAFALVVVNIILLVILFNIYPQQISEYDIDVEIWERYVKLGFGIVAPSLLLFVMEAVVPFLTDDLAVGVLVVAPVVLGVVGGMLIYMIRLSEDTLMDGRAIFAGLGGLAFDLLSLIRIFVLSDDAANPLFLLVLGVVGALAGAFVATRAWDY